MSTRCTWLFGRGASVANGLNWVVPADWNQEFEEGAIARDQQIERISLEIRNEMDKPSVDCSPYQRLLSTMSTDSIKDRAHLLLTTNWDYLLQRTVDDWMETNRPGWAPRFLGTYGTVYHLNGSVEPGEWQNRSTFMLENDAPRDRINSYESNQAFNYLLSSRLIVIVGMSFECDTDKGLLAALGQHEDNMLIGEATFIVVDPSQENIEYVKTGLSRFFPAAKICPVVNSFEGWIDAGMPELKGRILRP